MVHTVEERVVRYLQSHHTELLKNWMRRVIISKQDPLHESIETNALTMLHIVEHLLKHDHPDDQLLQELAHRVALERLEANVNIGDFVYNVNTGRSELFEHLHHMALSIEELHPIMTRINRYFDKFLYFAVDHYTQLYHQMLAEKSSFIEQTHKDHLTILGQMSSSFVHEFRNPLTSVIGFVQLLQERYPALEYMDVITKELNQLKFRINQFLLVSRKGVDKREAVTFRVKEVVEETLEFLYPMLVSSDVNLETKVDERLQVCGNPDGIRQVLINILVNSLDALSESVDGHVHIEGMADGHNAVIRLTNNGPAIPNDTISTIFEPFVSTKKLGTGIGLYVCRKIIQEHHGTISCESNEEHTTFQLVIPLDTHLHSYQ